MKPSKVINLVEFNCEGTDLLELDGESFCGIRLRGVEDQQTIGIEVKFDANFVLWGSFADMTDGSVFITNEEAQ